ncbi:MAG: hypothetical protein GY717_01660 [Rhodobacteraceae bacterium]|nr:hypothetical protein [Paracoccaceae bacterium]
MIRGILSGVLSGTFIGGIILVAASQFLPMVHLPQHAPEPGAVAVPARSVFNAEHPDVAPLLPATEGRPGGTETPGVGAPEPVSEAPVPDTSPAATPETGSAETGMEVPQAGVAPEVSGSSDGAVESMPGTAQPPLPGLDATPDAADPLADPEAADEAGTGLGTPGQEAAPPEVTGAGDDPEVASLAPAPSQPTPDVVPAADAPGAAPESGESPTAINAPVAEQPSISVPEAPQGPGLVQPELGAMSPGLGADSLPRIGADPAPATGTALQPALQRYAVPFEATPGVPLVALLLVDMPGGGVDPAGLAALPVPLTVAIDPNADGASARMTAWREAGAEVMVLTPLPAGATPADVEVSFQSFLAAVPHSVAVLDLPEALLQESRPRAAQVAEILAETGHGLVTYERGLNSGLQLARSKSVPAATVSRVFDDGTRDIAAIKRSLDHGAFRAGQAGSVILVGQVRAASLTAIAEWALGSRAATVSLAPVSSVLTAK